MTQREQLDKAARLGVDIKNTELLLDRLEGARGQLSNAHDELRMQTTVMKERVAWLIRELDSLRAEVKSSMPQGTTP